MDGVHERSVNLADEPVLWKKRLALAGRCLRILEQLTGWEMDRVFRLAQKSTAFRRWGRGR